MEIILLRHGKPSVDLKGHVNAQDFKQLAREYAQSGIQGHPPESLKDYFNSHYVVCSHLKRSLQSASKLGMTEIQLADKLFAETDIPHFDKFFITLPTMAWLISLRLMWLFGFSKNGESLSKAKNRAKEACNKLIALAQKNDKVILVGHGLMNRLIAKQLRLNNWQGPKSPGRNYWDYGVYRS